MGRKAFLQKALSAPSQSTKRPTIRATALAMKSVNGWLLPFAMASVLCLGCTVPWKSAWKKEAASLDTSAEAEEFEREGSGLRSTYRSKTSKPFGSGLDDRSRQIEKNLGFR